MPTSVFSADQITDQADKDAIVAKHNDMRRKVAKGLERQGVPVVQGYFNHV